MGDNVKNKKILIIILAIVLVAIIGLTGTFAWYVWSSSEDDVTHIVTGVGAVTVIYDAGADLTGQNIKPVSDKSLGLVKEITVSTSAEATNNVTFNLYLDINVLDENLKHTSFKYALYDDGGNEISVGNFFSPSTSECIVNGTNHIVLASEIISTTVSTYTLYIWIDGNVDNPVSMQGKNFSFTLHADGQNALLQENGSALSADVHSTTIPTGGSYVTGAVLNGNIYTYDSATTYTEGQSFPDVVANGDKYTYGDYEYIYNAGIGIIEDPSQGYYYQNTGGWLVMATDNGKTEYGEILEYINNTSVVNMNFTFSDPILGTGSIVTAPVIPSTITEMVGVFQGCTNLKGTVRVNSSNVNNAVEVFAGTSKDIRVEVPDSSTTYTSFANSGTPSNVELVIY